MYAVFEIGEEWISVIHVKYTTYWFCNVLLRVEGVDQNSILL
jgi:hypothetical protein